MIFARLFGLQPEEADDPPAHPPVAPGVRRAGSTEATGTQPALVTGSRPAQAKARPQTDTKPDAAGFDPYNSGVFKKTNAWERINRR
jgi:hypothetical protein